MLKPLNVNPQKMIRFYVGTGGVAKGQLCMIDNDTAIDATEGQTTAILIGVAFDNYDAGKVGQFYPLDDTEFEIPIYQGDTIDEATDEMIGTGFDLYVDNGDHKLDLNDESGEMFALMGYDNDRQVGYVRVIKALIYC